MAIKGVARFYKEKKRHIVTVQTEHKCVLDSCRALESEGFEVCYHFWCRQICYVDFQICIDFQVTYLPVQQNGIVSLEDMEKAVRPGQTVLVSVMGVNNEIGVVQPLKEISQVRTSLNNLKFLHPTFLLDLQKSKSIFAQ